ncbi:MAG: phosphoribosylamine--glycine ligase, partial [Candidatus Omnitrophica bacterium]|nr:phosphoribosylamine--glycine ligase [Candidatus Omnitrophota bacterium]
GKGVFVCPTLAEQETAIRSVLVDKIFGAAGGQIVIEEMLSGQEASILALSDGKTIRLLASSQDHKRIFDGDAGPNTGGMGAYSPAPAVTPALLSEIERTVIAPIVQAMAAEGHPYKGVLYAGMMLTAAGPLTLEFNVRFGDPETQVLLPRLRNDLVDVFLRLHAGALETVQLEWDRRFCVCVVVAAGGYPGSYRTGAAISGLPAAAACPDIQVFHAGTEKDGSAVRASGGRVLGVTGLGNTVAAAIENTYAAVELINFDGMQYRRDIGARALAR